MTLQETIEGLQYISDSPAQEHGGFHSNTIAIAKSALHYLTAEVRRREAAEKVILFEGGKIDGYCDVEELMKLYNEWRSEVKKQGG
jgi:16S rRNA U1498 N3-methylase RsmE